MKLRLEIGGGDTENVDRCDKGKPEDNKGEPSRDDSWSLDAMSPAALASPPLTADSAPSIPNRTFDRGYL